MRWSDAGAVGQCLHCVEIPGRWGTNFSEQHCSAQTKGLQFPLQPPVRAGLLNGAATRTTASNAEMNVPVFSSGLAL